MEEESFIGAFGDVPTDLAGDYSQLFIFRTEDFRAWYRRVRDAYNREVYNREVGSLRDETYVDTMSDADLAEHGLVRIPVDADGVPIHVGDVMDKGRVTCIRDYGKGWEVILDSLYTFDTPILHHRAPTVEDVRREFACVLMGKREFDGDVTEAVAEYAAKLRLANDGEEQ